MATNPPALFQLKTYMRISLTSLLLRRREKRSARRSECWLEREEGEWESFPPPKIFHLSQRMNPRLAPDSPLYLTGGLSGYENRGYQRYGASGHYTEKQKEKLLFFIRGIFSQSHFPKLCAFFFS